MMRLLSDVPLPPYTHIPGRTPHPVRDPHGHSYALPTDHPEPIDPLRWHESRAYLHGLDLFNHGYYWEAHESWEGLWHAAGRKGMIADFLKALIKLAAAGVKHLEGVAAGVRSHARRAEELFRTLSIDGVFLGLRLDELTSLANAIAAHGWPEPPPLLLPTAFPDSQSSSRATPP